MFFFEKLGLLIARRWKHRNYDAQCFPEIACRTLAELPPSEHVDYIDVVRWCHGPAPLPQQYDLRAQFGNPPLTVYRNEHFYIEVLFWVDGTTSIHQHGFSGAFHVLHGSSIHSRYLFKQEHRFNDQLMTGDIRLQSIELLTRGASRPIEPSRQLIHSLFHLDRPSVSVVVRTEADAHALPQYAYAKPSLAFNSFYRTESLIRKLQTLELLGQTEHPAFEEIARDSIANSDCVAAYFLLDKVFHCLKSEYVFNEFLERVRPKHERLVGVLRPVFAERRRELNIIARRGRIRDPDHRFFLALLLNVPQRQHILDLISERYPQRSPVESILGWVKSLAETRLEQDAGKNAIGIELDESSLLIFRALLEGLSFEQVIERMKAEYAEEDVENELASIRQMCEAFKSSLLFKPLFTTGETRASSSTRAFDPHTAASAMIQARS